MSQESPLPRPHYTEYDSRLGAYAVIVRPRGGHDEPGGSGAGAGRDQHAGDDAEILLAMWNDGRWTLPGGGVDLHESPEEGVVREVREETGYDVELVDLLGVETDVIPSSGRTTATRGRPLRAIRVYYRARVVGGELTHEEAGSTNEARWLPVAEVAGLPRSSMVDTGRRLLGRRLPAPER